MAPRGQPSCAQTLQETRHTGVWPGRSLLHSWTGTLKCLTTSGMGQGKDTQPGYKHVTSIQLARAMGLLHIPPRRYQVFLVAICSMANSLYNEVSVNGRGVDVPAWKGQFAPGGNGPQTGCLTAALLKHCHHECHYLGISSIDYNEITSESVLCMSTIWGQLSFSVAFLLDLRICAMSATNNVIT